jgi:hypothetical protein
MMILASTQRAISKLICQTRHNTTDLIADRFRNAIWRFFEVDLAETEQVNPNPRLVGKVKELPSVKQTLIVKHRLLQILQETPPLLERRQGLAINKNE